MPPSCLLSRPLFITTRGGAGIGDAAAVARTPASSNAVAALRESDSESRSRMSVATSFIAGRRSGSCAQQRSMIQMYDSGARAAISATSGLAPAEAARGGHETTDEETTGAAAAVAYCAEEDGREEGSGAGAGWWTCFAPLSLRHNYSNNGAQDQNRHAASSSTIP